MTPVCPICGADMALERQDWWILRYECTVCGTFVRVAVSLDLVPMGTNYDTVKAAVIEVLDRIALERPPH